MKAYMSIFTTAIDSPNFPFLQSSHIPWILDVQDQDSETELGVLRGHMARANPQAKSLIEHLSSSLSGANTSECSRDDTSAPAPRLGGPRRLERDVMVLFNGPAHHYVTPKFYVDTKPATGKVVPTWNYAAVQVYGKLSVYYDTAKDSSTDAFLTKAVADLSRLAETEIMGYERPWKVEDAPGSYVELLKKAIIGIEIEITDMGGKWKMSQEMKGRDSQGVEDGFNALGTDEGRQIAEMVRSRRKGEQNS
ncbi:transcriptional regulator [Diaporthe helianthi]|uniref:Transcriptional regulator n=1 Tax=Diaporthe helianthi TaxID=158607 RepID=A0A2P5HVD1_DIAHE|nr:transcriptional regulator [Diaporthe helianthi]